MRPHYKTQGIRGTPTVNVRSCSQEKEPAPVPREHQTTNIERPTSIDAATGSLWMFDVGCSPPSAIHSHPTLPTHFAGCSSIHTALRSPEEKETRVRRVSVPVFTRLCLTLAGMRMVIPAFKRMV